MSEEAVYEVMLRFFIKADSKSEAWKVLQRISEDIRERFPEVVRSEPFDVSEHEDKTSGNCNRERKHNSSMVEDGTLLKVRNVLLKIRRKVTLGPPAPLPYGMPQEPNFNTNSTNLLAVIAPNKLKGSPVQNFVPPPPEQLAKTPKEVLDFTTYAEPWNTYRLKDGQVIKIKLNVSAIARFKDLYDGNGDPFYLVQSGTTFIPVPKEMESKRT